MGMRKAAFALAIGILPTIACAGQQHKTLKAIQFDIVLGRLVGYSQHFQTKRSTSVNTIGSARESLTLNITKGVADVHYELVADGTSWTIDMIEGKEVTIERRVGDVEITQLRQPRSGNISLLVQDTSGQRYYSAKSFWHLMLRYPSCREQLFSLVHFVRPGLRLDVSLEQLQAQLIQMAKFERPVSRDRVIELVRQMSSDQFADRQAADRKLRQIGLSAFPFLERLNMGRLEAEQRMRIKRMMREITWQRSDSPGRVAEWLVNDPSVWLALLTSNEEEVRAIAKAQLSRVYGQEFEFDLTADETTRQRQAEVLRNEFKR